MRKQKKLLAALATAIMAACGDNPPSLIPDDLGPGAQAPKADAGVRDSGVPDRGMVTCPPEAVLCSFNEGVEHCNGQKEPLRPCPFGCRDDEKGCCEAPGEGCGPPPRVDGGIPPDSGGQTDAGARDAEGGKDAHPDAAEEPDAEEPRDAEPAPDAEEAPDMGRPDGDVGRDAQPADAGPPADTGVPPDTGVRPDSGVPPDSGVRPDTGPPDNGVHPDAEEPDTGEQDASQVDAGGMDAGAVDAEGLDATAADATAGDADVDAGPPDSGVPPSRCLNGYQLHSWTDTGGATRRICAKRTEVTVGEAQDASCQLSSHNSTDRQRPAFLSWNQATACAQLVDAASAQGGVMPGIRLPTREEWAAVAQVLGTMSITCTNAHVDNGCGSAQSAPVCAHSDIGGFCDLAGNIREWTADQAGTSAWAVGGDWTFPSGAASGFTTPDTVPKDTEQDASRLFGWLGARFVHNPLP